MCIHVGSAHQSSIYIMKYDVWSCSFFIFWMQSSGFYFLFWWLCFGDSFLNVQIDWLWFASVIMGFQWLINSVVVDSEIDDWVSVIGWCICIWWLYCSGDWFWDSMLLMGPVWKFDETWPSYCSIVYHDHPVWKFMKRGPSRILRVGAFSEEIEASCQ